MSSVAALAAAPSHKADRLSPVPWSKVIGVVWLQRRSMLLWYFGACLAIGVGIYVYGFGPRLAWSSFVSHGCTVSITAWCSTYGYANPHLGSQASASYTGCVIAALAFAIIAGTFISGPLMARELETGTFRFAFTQGVGRRRLLVANLVLIGFAVTVTTCGLGLLLGWYGKAVDGLLLTNPWRPGMFETTPLTLPVWCLLAVTTGALLGAVLRRVIPAMAGTMVTVGVLAWCGGVWSSAAVGLSPLKMRWTSLTSNYIAGPLVSAATPGQGPPGAWLVRGWFEGSHGQVLTVNPQSETLVPFKASDPTQWLALHHVTYWISYETPGRYWLFNGVEAFALLVISVALVVATLAVIRRS
jgi:hypothetical protein